MTVLARSLRLKIRCKAAPAQTPDGGTIALLPASILNQAGFWKSEADSGCSLCLPGRRTASPGGSVLEKMRYPQIEIFL